MPNNNNKSGNLGFEATLWATADKLRGNLAAADIAAHGHVLTPGRYVGAEEAEDDGEPFEEKMKQLTQSAKLELAIKANLGGLEYA